MAVLEVPQGGVGFFSVVFFFLCVCVLENPLNMKTKGNTKFFNIGNKLDM